MYKSMYVWLFNRVTDALDELAQGDAAKAEEILKKAQQETEEMYISG